MELCLREPRHQPKATFSVAVGLIFIYIVPLAETNQCWKPAQVPTCWDSPSGSLLREELALRTASATPSPACRVGKDIKQRPFGCEDTFLAGNAAPTWKCYAENPDACIFSAKRKVILREYLFPEETGSDWRCDLEAIAHPMWSSPGRWLLVLSADTTFCLAEPLSCSLSQSWSDFLPSREYMYLDFIFLAVLLLPKISVFPWEEEEVSLEGGLELEHHGYKT